MSEPADDRQLLRRIEGGDSAAVQLLFARYHTRLYRFIERQIGNTSVSEELTNEVFLDIWRQAGRFEGRSSVSTWLMAIARNKAISYLRKRRDEALDSDKAALIVDHADTPETSVQKASKAERMRALIDQLSTDHKAVIDLVYYHEMSIKEVAEVLDIPQNTVKTRVFHARKKLAGLMNDAGLDRGWP